jgi:hypothetical protein
MLTLTANVNATAQRMFATSNRKKCVCKEFLNRGKFKAALYGRLTVFCRIHAQTLVRRVVLPGREM